MLSLITRRVVAMIASCEMLLLGWTSPRLAFFRSLVAMQSPRSAWGQNRTDGVTRMGFAE
jgi:predicted small integral membrane protein